MYVCTTFKIDGSVVELCFHLWLCNHYENKKPRLCDERDKNAKEVKSVMNVLLRLYYSISTIQQRSVMFLVAWSKRCKVERRNKRDMSSPDTKKPRMKSSIVVVACVRNIKDSKRKGLFDVPRMFFPQTIPICLQLHGHNNIKMQNCIKQLSFPFFGSLIQSIKSPFVSYIWSPFNMGPPKNRALFCQKRLIKISFPFFYYYQSMNQVPFQMWPLAYYSCITTVSTF